MDKIYCKVCGHLLFEIDTNTFETIVSGENKPHIKFYGYEKPRLKHINVSTTCDRCGDIDSHTF